MAREFVVGIPQIDMPCKYREGKKSTYAIWICQVTYPLTLSTHTVVEKKPQQLLTNEKTHQSKLSTNFVFPRDFFRTTILDFI